MNALLVILGLALFATVITYEGFRFFASQFLVVFHIQTSTIVVVFLFVFIILCTIFPALILLSNSK
jgi:hypothetical protein